LVSGESLQEMFEADSFKHFKIYRIDGRLRVRDHARHSYSYRQAGLAPRMVDAITG
jgi:hypothetical protein